MPELWAAVNEYTKPGQRTLSSLGRVPALLAQAAGRQFAFLVRSLSAFAPAAQL